MFEKGADFAKEITDACLAFDERSATSAIHRLIEQLRKTAETFPKNEAKTILTQLRSARLFRLMEIVAEEFIGNGQDAPEIQRQFAQAMIELKRLHAATFVLETLKNTTVETPEENLEARGLLGRAHKQLYVDRDRFDRTRGKRRLEEALRCYNEVYQQDGTRLWHGINVVALLFRAERDKIVLTGYGDPREIARKIFDTLTQKSPDEQDMWDLAIGLEVCIALGRPADAATYLSKYGKLADAFGLASTVRNLEEIWQLDVRQEPGATVLPVLRSCLIRKAGGAIQLSSTDFHYEKQFGRSPAAPIEWYQDGLERCKAIGRIRHRYNPEESGTGFLIAGHSLHESLGEAPVFVTNAHITTDDKTTLLSSDLKPIPREKVIVSFDLIAPGKEYWIEEVLWTSPPFGPNDPHSPHCDTTIARLNDLPPGITTLPLAPAQREWNSSPQINFKRVYIIGYPKGHLSISLNDNQIVDKSDRLLRHRAPTSPGSSGSPVFNEDWEVVALHHGGCDYLPALNGEGTVQANEGIWFGAIRRQLAQRALATTP